jgi:hypothetical protein
MPSKLFVALISVTIISAAGCRSNNDGNGQATPAPTQQAATQPPAPAANASPAAAGVPAAPGAPPAAGGGGNSNADADACRLLTSEEIQAVQGEGVKTTKATDASSGPLSVSQCIYETTNFTNSVSLTLTSKNYKVQGEGPREFWRKNFGGERGREREGEGEHGKERREKERREGRGGARGEEEEEGLPPTRVRGVGDDAYWVGNDKAGALFVLKGDKFIRISLGGGGRREEKIEKTRTLALRALKRI